MIITGKEKAFLGGLGAGITAFAGQLSVSEKINIKTLAWSVGAWVFTHVVVYYTTNTSVANSPTDLGTQIGQVIAPSEKPADLVEPPPPTAPSV